MSSGWNYWLLGLAGPALLLALLSLRGERARAAYFARRLAEASGYHPPATVILPVKGHDEGLRENLAALASLDYPDYELILTARTAADIPSGVLPRKVKVVLAHGTGSRASEKVQNLSAGVRAARHKSEILAFADSDVAVTPRWLRALAAPLAEPGVGASTGYRWFTPEPADPWSVLRAVWDAAVCGLLGPGDNRFAWGGSMAIRKETFFETGVFDRWKEALSDDYALSAAVHEAGLTIAFAPGALAPSAEHASAAGFFSWARRQVLITRLYDPPLWRAGLAAHAVYCAGMAATAVAWQQGSAIAPWLLAAQIAPGMLKGAGRARRARAALPGRAAWFRRWGWAHAAAAPLAAWVWLIVLVSAAFGNTVRWRGYKYHVTGRV